MMGNPVRLRNPVEEIIEESREVVSVVRGGPWRPIGAVEFPHPREAARMMWFSRTHIIVDLEGIDHRSRVAKALESLSWRDSGESRLLLERLIINLDY